jgi:hypothetical protein
MPDPIVQIIRTAIMNPIVTNLEELKWEIEFQLDLYFNQQEP